MTNGFQADRRLDRLTTILRPIGCPLCRFWDGTVLADDDGNYSRPEDCPQCGRDVPYTQTVRLEGVALEDV